MLVRAARMLLFVLVVLSFVTFVWPTRWRYDHMTVDGNVVPVRIDRLTGDADMLLPDDGWVPVENPQQPGAADVGPAS